MATEVELKLAFPADALAAVEAHPLIAASTAHGPEKLLDNIYYDTPDLVLHANRIAVRTRRIGERMLQTIKCAAQSVGGLSSRPEWEQPYTGSFDFSTVDVPDVQTLLIQRQADLLPVFSTVFRRQTRLAMPRPGVRILLMIDHGKVVTGDDAAPISELELELAEGSPADLLDFAIALGQDLPLLPQDVSKAERGFRLFRREAEQAQRPGKLRLNRQLTALEAYRHLIGEAQRCWLANLHGALNHPEEPEFIHQYRVTLRRMNTLIKLFRPVLDPAYAVEWTATLKGLARQSGEARDLDVMIESILQPMSCTEEASPHQALVQQMLAATLAHRQAAEAAFAGSISPQPILHFTRAQLLLDMSRDLPAARFVEKRLSKLHRRAVRHYQAASMNPTAEAAHRLRIALKHLRYSCEYFSPLFADEAMLTDYARQAARIQDDLGFINDVHQARARLAAWSADDAALRAGLQLLENWYQGEVDRRLQGALDKTGTLLGECLPWCMACERHGKPARRHLKDSVE